MISFTEYLQLREGLLPARPPAKGLPRINTTPLTQVQRRKMVPPFRPPVPAQAVAPTVTAVAPPKLIPKIKPWLPVGGIPCS